MNPSMTQLSTALTGKTDLAQLSLSELQQLAGQYPYWGPVQVLIAGKLARDGSEELNDQLERSMLYMVNPLRLQQLLKPEPFLSIDDDTDAADETLTLAVTNDQPAIAAPAFAAKLEQPATVEEVVVQEEKTDTVSIEETTEEQAPEVPVTAVPADEPAPVKTGQAIPTLPGMENASMELSFEPYHTVDYFASQGIRIRDEDKNPDRFSRQLRSFTEWLKTMKRLPTGEAVVGSPTDERKVVQLAEHSIEDRDVLTEAMAEVWEKQGDYAQAIRIYEKLSLLDPAKSSYFAAKIDQLKHA
ncbi:MAG: tetratricopeptide repeat-containing protein [Chitinophagaceae bacterium]|nr:tetratricopeptide repeat-containing protein [Chitinophagaceae bacterium]